jgi:hypothetical protein
MEILWTGFICTLNFTGVALSDIPKNAAIQNLTITHSLYAAELTLIWLGSDAA